jgi:hypothetical protein
VPSKLVVTPTPLLEFFLDRFRIEPGRNLALGLSGNVVLVRQEEHLDVNVVLIIMITDLIPVLHKRDELREVLDIMCPRSFFSIDVFLEEDRVSDRTVRVMVSTNHFAGKNTIKDRVLIVDFDRWLSWTLP